MASINIVKTKSELAEGLYFNIEGLKRIGEAFVLHGWVVDPDRLLRSVLISKPGTPKTFELSDKMIRFERPDVNSAFNAPHASTHTHYGFAAILEGFTGAKDFQSLGVVLVAGNGNAFVETVEINTVSATNENLPQLLGIVPDSVVDAERCKKFFAPLFDVFAKEAHAPEKALDEVYGAKHQAESPVISVVIPLYGDTRFEQIQIPAFAALGRPDWELIFAVDDPRILGSVRDNVKRLSGLYGLRARVVAPTTNLGFSGINNFAAKFARGAKLLFLNSDCFISNTAPIERAIQWLQDDKHGAVGFRLTYADRTIQHDGMSVSRFNGDHHFLLNDHPRRGLPVNLIPAKPSNDESVLLTAACLMMRKSSFDLVGGYNRAYLRGDFEDSDLCLKLIEKGLKLGIIRTQGLFHLERQTIAAQEGGLRTKITLINSYIYSQKWQPVLQKGLPALEVIA